MGYLSYMKIIISEDQFTKISNNPKVWGLIGIVEDRPKISPELVKTKSDYIELKYLGTIDGEVPSKKEVDGLPMYTSVDLSMKYLGNVKPKKGGGYVKWGE